MLIGYGYSSHGCMVPWKEIREIEVKERGNYPMREVRKWEKKYGIKDDMPTIWLTNERMALTYGDGADMIDTILSLTDEELTAYMKAEDIEPPEKFDLSMGTLIPESDDGDDGYLFVYTGKRPPDPVEFLKQLMGIVR